VTAFWSLAALLCAAAVGFLLWPLWRQRKTSGRWSVVGLVSAIAVVPLAAGLYLTVTTWNPEAASQASEGMRLVTELARRMRENPDDAAGWRLLGRSYMALGQHVQGRNAYREAWTRTAEPDNELKVAFGESLVLTDRAMLTGEGGRLFEEVLEEEPDNIKALWYGGLAAQELGAEREWRARWSRLLALGPPEPLERVLRTELGLTEGAPVATAAADGPNVRVKVELGAGRSIETLGPQTMLFIFASAPDGGPPIAALREPATTVPGEFVLSDADSMLAGRSLADFEELTLVARLSPSGQPTAQPGDWFAQTTFRPKEGGVVELTIDEVVQ
jgi:cytochrome c-type biogenesis protein CcmH